MARTINRRDFLTLAGLGGAVFASGLGYRTGAAARTYSAAQDFYFVQLSDSHWGFSGPEINPDADGTLRKAVAAVMALRDGPVVVLFTVVLVHGPDDGAERGKGTRKSREI